MLAAIAIFAVAGGALAVNAKSAFQRTIYTSPDADTKAIHTVVNATIVASGASKTYATAIYDVLPVYTYTAVQQ